MSYYRGNSRTNIQRNSINSNDGQTGAKRRKSNRWSSRSKLREDEMNLKRGRNESISYDTPLFRTPFSLSTSRDQAQSLSYDGDRYNRDSDMYNYNDLQYNNFNHQGSLTSPGRNMRDNQRSNSAQFEMRNRQFVEPQHSGPAWIWEKYNSEIHNWQDKHKLSYYKSRCMALEFENQMLFEQVKSLIQENSVFAEERGLVPVMLLPHFPGGRKGFESGNAAAETPTKVAESAKEKGKNREISDESLVCDVPDTMVAVIEKSMRHKLNLYKQRKEGAAKEKKEEEGKKEELNKEGPKEPRGFKRKEELEQLYGEKAELIQSLETSVQHDFNRNCDTYNPQMWMTEPMNPISVV